MLKIYRSRQIGKDGAVEALACIEAKDLNWGIFYGVSQSGEEKWDLDNAYKLLGYEPEDDGAAEVYQKKYKKT